jgi:undecaprenyl pyrophosphate phosphatase UppP
VKPHHWKNPEILQIYEATLSKWNAWLKIVILIIPALALGVFVELAGPHLWVGAVALAVIAIQIATLVFLSEKLAEIFASRAVEAAIRNDPSLEKNGIATQSDY